MPQSSSNAVAPSRTDLTVAAVVLAGGRSRRMGSAKGLLPWRGQPLLRHQLNVLREAGLAPVIAVTHLPDYVPLLADCPWVRSVHQPNPDAPSMDSLPRGLQVLAAGVSCVVVPVDAPIAPQLPWASLMHTNGHAARVCHRGRPAHPVWLSADLVSHVCGLDPSTARLDHVLQRLHDVVDIEVDNPDVLLNLNAPSDQPR